MLEKPEKKKKKPQKPLRRKGLKVRRKYKRKGKAAIATKQLDDLVRLIVARRDVNAQGVPCCQRCGSTERLAVSHIKPKGKFPWMRFDLLNVLRKCRSCHCWWHENPTESGAWFANTYAARAAYLGEKVQKPVPIKDIKGAALHELTNKLAELENETPF